MKGPTVVVAAPQEGPLAHLGRDIQRAAQMQFESRPMTAALSGLRFVTSDETSGTAPYSNPETVAERTQKLVDTGQIVGWVGGVDSDALAVELPRLSAAGVSAVSPAATATPFNRRDQGFPGAPIKYYPAFDKYGLSFARTAPTDKLLGSACLDWMARAGVKRVFTVDTGDTDGDSFSSAIETGAPTSGLTLVGHESVPAATADWEGVVKQAGAAGAQALIWGSASGSGDLELWKAVASSRLSVKMMSGPAMPPSSLPRLSKLVASSTLCTATVPPAEQTHASASFARAFRSRWGHDPTPGALRGAAAMGLILEAIDKSSGSGLRNPISDATRQGIARELARSRTVKSLLGDIRLDSLGNWTQAPVGIWTSEGNTLKFRQLQ